MKKLKNGFSNNIIIYQMPLIERILGIVSAVFLTLLPIVGLIVPLYEDIKEFFMLLGLLLAMIMYCIFMYFIVFKTYICIDIKNNKIVIRKFPGYKKEELSLYELVDIKVSDGLPAEFKDFFTIDIKFKGYTKQITSWSVGPGSLPLTGSYRKQRKRLEKFCDECNKYLKNRLQNDFIDSNL